jgi:biopolymer transport protein ExbB/TolQ
MNFIPGLLAAQQGGFTLTYIWNQATPEAKVIIVILLIFSIFAWSVMASKALQMRRAQRLNHYFEAEFRQQQSVLSIFDRKLQVDGCPLFSVYLDGCNDLEGHLRLADGTRKVHATLKVAVAAQAGARADLAVMAPGVSAALVTTVAGLLVAIPSMFGYNWLVHTLRVHTVELDNFAQALASRMETEFLKDE